LIKRLWKEYQLKSAGENNQQTLEFTSLEPELLSTMINEAVYFLVELLYKLLCLRNYQGKEHVACDLMMNDTFHLSSRVGKSPEAIKAAKSIGVPRNVIQRAVDRMNYLEQYDLMTPTLPLLKAKRIKIVNGAIIRKADYSEEEFKKKKNIHYETSVLAKTRLIKLLSTFEF